MISDRSLAGTSPFAAVNVGAGAVEGLESYAASQDRLAKMEDKRMDIDSRLAEAERAKKLAAVQYGVNSEEYAKKANDEYQLKKMQSIYEVEKYKEVLSKQTIATEKIVYKIDTVYIETKKNFWGKEKTNTTIKSDSVVTEKTDTTGIQ